MSVKQFRLTDISKHDKEGDLWIIIYHNVYDVSKFADEHPGGVNIFLGVAGDDATNGFNAIGHSDSAREDLKKFLVGAIHPEDLHKLKTPLQGTQSSIGGIALALSLLAICIGLIIRSLFFA